MKAGKSHVVPISGPALAIIKRQAEQRENEFVFPGDKRAGLSNMALLMTLRRMGRSDLTAHGFRSTFRDWAGDKSDFAREVVEAALAHAVGDKAEQAFSVACVRSAFARARLVSSTGETSLRLTRRRSSMAVIVSRSVDKDVFQ